VQSKVHAVGRAEPIRRAPADIGLVSLDILLELPSGADAAVNSSGQVRASRATAAVAASRVARFVEKEQGVRQDLSS
jgi:hypothetical protein